MIGEISDVIISPNNKSVSWAIIGVGGFLSLAKHDVAIPVNQLVIELLLKGATKEALKAMLKFEYLKKTAAR